MFKNTILLLTFLLLQINAFAIGSEGTVRNASVIPKKEKVGILKKLRERILIKKISKLVENMDTLECDIISLYNGYSLMAEIIEVNDKQVIYKECDDPAPTIDSLTCNEVDFIHLADGTQYQCRHPNLPRRSRKANFRKTGTQDLAESKLQCDILVMINKDQLDVDIIEVKNEMLLYKTCGDETATIDSVALSEIRTYRKKNGYAKRVNRYDAEKRSGNSGGDGLLSIFKALLISAVVLVLLLIFAILINL